MNNNLWANSYWYFFHCFSYNLNERVLTPYNINIINIFIQNLFYKIPCEKCKMDAINYFEKSNFSKIKTKEEYKIFFFTFHNYVNKKLRKPIANTNILNRYKNISCLEHLRIIDSIIFKNKLNKKIYKFFSIISK